MYDANVMPYPSDDERNALIEDIGDDGEQVAEMLDPIAYYVHGDTPALARTGVTDVDAAALSDAHSGPRGHVGAWADLGYTSDADAFAADPSPHIGEAFDADDYARPRNGLGTYFESDAS